MRRAIVFLFSSLTFLLIFAIPGRTEATPAQLTYHWRHYAFTLKVQPTWQAEEERWTYEGILIAPLKLETASGAIAELPNGVVRETVSGWNKGAIAASIDELIAKSFNRDAREVTIKTVSGAVVFDGVGIPGRRVESAIAAELTVAALQQEIVSITLPVTELSPKVTVLDPELIKRGIKEYVTVGESDFSNSPVNRRHNIDVGISRFNGHIIEKGETFSFNAVLGPVGAATGFRKELVILGDKTLPDYGGGLCQVSTTAYRGIWEYGFPVVQRRNHSFAVNHYFPQGTDATIYPPSVDMKFRNDSPGALLIQTHTEGDDAYYVYYGTRDDRTSEIIGPYIWARVGAPPERREFTTDLAPGETKKVGEAVAGMRVNWFRLVTRGGTGAMLEKFHSAYQARPRYYLVGSEVPAASGAAIAPAQ